MILKKNFFQELFVCLIIFLATLHSYYFYQISLAPFPVISFLLLIINSKKPSKNGIIIVSYLYLIFILNATFGLIYAGSDYYYNSLLGIIIGPLFFILFIEKYLSNKELLIKCIKKVLFIHLLAFYIQLFLFYATGYQIDYLTIVTGEASRNEGGGVITDLIRSSGLFNEPASYSLYVAFFAIVVISNDKKFSLLTAVALLSCVLSLSVGGIVYAVFGVIYYFMFINRSLKHLIATIMGLIVIVSYFAYSYFEFLKLYFESRFSSTNEDVSSNVRFKEGFDYFFSQSFFKQFTGLGIGNYTSGDISTIASGFMAIGVHLGYLFTLLYLIINVFIFKKYKYKFIYILIFLFFLTSTMTYLNIHYWMFFAIIGIISQSLKPQLKYNGQ